MRRAFAYAPIELDGPPRPGERSVVSAPVLVEAAGPHRPLELLDQREQFYEARQLLCDACRCLLRGGMPLAVVAEVARGAVGTLDYLRHHPADVARFASGREVEDWRIG
jgi:hypothetical protein